MGRDQAKLKTGGALLIAAAVGLCFFGAWRLIDYASQRLLKLDAQLVARNLTAEILQQGIGADSFRASNGLIRTDGLGSLAGAHRVSGVRQFRLLDEQDRVRFDSIAHVDSAALAWDHGESTRIVAPLSEGGAVFGSLEVLVDQTDRAEVFRKISLGLGASVALLLILAAGAPAYLAARRAREQRKAQDEARHAALHDALTGLENRQAFSDDLRRVVSATSPGALALIAVDLDRFKEINDMLGHTAGDAVIVEAARRISDVTRGAEFAARTGGDEFAIAIRCDDLAEAEAVAARLHKAFHEPFTIEGRVIHCSASLGFAMHPQHADRADELARCADVALECAKHAGRNMVRSFDSAMDGALRRRRSLQHDLREAIMRDSLDVHFQPLVGLETSKVKGFEALLRWRHPERGQIAPQEFVAIAEESGLILSLGALVLKKSCMAAASWPQPWTVAVNLSPAQFVSGALYCEVERALAESGLPPERLELEITEGLLLDTSERTFEQLDRLRELGVRIALDDFGAGYSSLSYLWRLSLDKLKIDRAFIMEMGEDPRIAAIVSAVMTLGRALDLEVTAEGVETAEQFEQLRRLGCDTAQGYWLSRPIPDAAEAAERAERRLSLRVVEVA